MALNLDHKGYVKGKTTDELEKCYQSSCDCSNESGVMYATRFTSATVESAKALSGEPGLAQSEKMLGFSKSWKTMKHSDTYLAAVGQELDSRKNDK
jgi:hypothetical protein